MSLLEKFTDRHTLYCLIGELDVVEVKERVKKAIEDYNQSKGTFHVTAFRVNLVCDRDGLSKKFCYIWITNPLVYDLFIRKEIIVDGITFHSAFVMNVGEECSSHIIRARYSESDVTIRHDDIKKIFLPYVSDANKRFDMTLHNGKTITVGYPFVSIRRGWVYVTFDPETRDAQFALLMSKKVTLSNFILIFNHSLLPALPSTSSNFPGETPPPSPSQA